MSPKAPRSELRRTAPYRVRLALALLAVSAFGCLSQSARGAALSTLRPAASTCSAVTTVPSAKGTWSTAGLRDLDLAGGRAGWAVGFQATPSSFRPLIEQLTNGRFRHAPSPRVANGGLVSVSVVSRSDVWAVGSVPSGELIEHWDGKAWAVVPSPRPGKNAQLASVSGSSPSDVWAVGTYFNNVFNASLILHWDGLNWAVVPSPSPGYYENYLRGVVAVSDHDAWAVGDYISKDNRVHLLIEHWDGTSWTAVQSPTGGRDEYLYGVGVGPGGHVYAVGASGQRALIEQWDGSRWRRVPLRLRGSLLSVAANEDGVWAAGEQDDATLLVRYRAGRWLRVPSANPGGDYNVFWGVAANNTGITWGVGASRDVSTNYLPLVETCD